MPVLNARCVRAIVPQLMEALVNVEDSFGKAGIPLAPGRYRVCKCKDGLGNPKPCVPPQIGFLVRSNGYH